MKSTDTPKHVPYPRRLSLKTGLLLLVWLTGSVLAMDNTASHLSRDQATLSAQSMYTYRWNEVDWMQRFKEVYLYNSQNQLTQASRHISSSGTWYNDWQISLNYDSDGLLLERLSLLGTGLDWVNDFRDQYSYDDSARRIEAVHQLADGDSWRNSERHLYFYDEQNRLSEEIVQSRVGNNWLNDIRIFSLYNQVGLLDSVLMQSWDYDEEGWILNTLQRYSYNGEGLQTQRIGQLWVVDHWRNKDREIISYNSTGQVTDKIIQIWLGSSWINIERTANSYDPDMFLAVSTIQEWDYDEAIWYDNSRELFSYDNDGNHLSSTIQFWQSQDSLWLNDWRYEWNYPSTDIGFMQLPDHFELSQNYPNPFNPTTTISFVLSESGNVSLRVFDILGRELITLRESSLTPGHYSAQWNGLDDSGNPVSAGVYVCRLQSESESQSIKMVFLK